MEPIEIKCYRQYDMIRDEMWYSLIVLKNGAEYRVQFDNHCSEEELGRRLKELLRNVEE